MYVKQTVFNFLVIFTINTLAENAANDLDLARVFRTPKDFSRVNFDHFEILERNNFDPTPATQQEPETTNEDVPPSVSAPAPDQQHPKSVANAQVMLRFGGDDIHGKNCIQTPSKPCPTSIRPYPTHNHLPQMNEMIRYHPPYCHPSYQTIPYFPPPPPSYGYPYPPYAFPGPYYPRPEFERGPCGGYQGQLYPGYDSSSCSQEKRNFLEGNGAFESTSASPKIITTTDLTDDVIPECQKCPASPIKFPIEMSPSHHHQNRPSEYYYPDESGTGIYPEFKEQEIKLKPYLSHTDPISSFNITDSDEFPDFIKKADVAEPEWSKVVFVDSPKENSQQPSASVPTKKTYSKFTDFIKKEDGLEPKWSEVVNIKPEDDNGYHNQQPYTTDPHNNNTKEDRPDTFPDFMKKKDFVKPDWSEDIYIQPPQGDSNQQYPHHPLNHLESHPNKYDQNKFPNFITKENLAEPDWSKDIHIKPPQGNCNHQHPHRPCNRPENHPNENDHSKFPDFIKQGELTEPDWSKDIHMKPPQGNCNHQHPHRPCNHPESHPNENDHSKFPDFIKKEDLTEPDWSKNIHTKPAQGNCFHQHPHRPCNHPEIHTNENDHGKFPDFVKKEDLAEPDWSKDIHMKPPQGNCNHQQPHHPCNHPESHPNKNDHSKFPDFITKEDLIEPDWSEDIHIKPPQGNCNNQNPHRPCNHPEIHPNENDHGKFPDFVKKEDLDEPDWSKDIHIKPPHGNCNHQNPHRPCNHPEIHPNENDHDKFPVFVKKEDLAEPDWSKDIHFKPPHGNCNHQNPHRTCNHPEIHPNENDHGKFPDFVKKEDLAEPDWSKDIHIKPPQGNCNHQYSHRPCNHPESHPNKNDHSKFPDFITKEDLIEPDWSVDIHIKPPQGNCNHQHPHHFNNNPQLHLNKDDHGKFPDFVKKEDLKEPERSEDIDVKLPQDNHQHAEKPFHLSQTHPEEYNHSKFSDLIDNEDMVESSSPFTRYPIENNHGKFPDFLKNEDLVEPEIFLDYPRKEDLAVPVKFPDLTEEKDLVKPRKSSDFIKEGKDLLEHKWREVNHVKPSRDDNNYLYSHRPNNPPENYPNGKSDGKFPDFIKKEDLETKDWSDIDNVKYPIDSSYHENSMNSVVKNPNDPEIGKFPDSLKEKDLIKPDGPEVMNIGSLTNDIQMNAPEHPLRQLPTSPEIEQNDSIPVNGEPNSEASKPPTYIQPLSSPDHDQLTNPLEVEQKPHMYLLPVDKPLNKYIHIKPMVIYVNQKPGTDVQEAKQEPDINEIEGWLNKSLVPYVCKACGHKPKLLVTYPIKNDRTQTEEDINISGCQCCRQNGFCNCCNCHRNPSIPFGHRFPSDVDSLLQVAKSPVYDEVPLPRIYYGGRRPGEYSTGYSSSSASSLSSSVSQVGDQRPKVYLSGCHSSQGSGFYSDPTRNVFYQRPKVVDFIRTTSPYLPVIQHTRMEEPEWYSVVPKYDIVPKKVTPIDIPDLVATGVFVCKQCNTPHHRGIVCHREYVPRDVIEEDPFLRRSL